MGDVVGRGLRAAVIMGRIRSSLRSYAILTDDPAEILTLVDRKLQRFEPGEMTTVLVATFDPDHRYVTLSSAGHLPPILAPLGAVPALVDLPIDPPLGAVAGHKRAATTIDMAPGSVLCLFTDGLVERRDVDIDQRIGELLAVIAADDPEAVCATAVRNMIGTEASADDAAILVVRRTADEPTAPLTIEMPAVAASLRHIRVVLRQWLTAVGAGPDESLDVLLAVGEAAANAVEHAYGAARGTVSVHVELDGVDVIARVVDTGNWRESRGEDRGRGTQMMRNASDELQVDTGPQGTEIRIRRRLAR